MAPPLSKTQIDQLYDLYYNKNNFVGRDRLYKLARNNDIIISRRQVWDWLKNQEVNQLHRRVFKKAHIISTVMDSPNKQVGIDLINMEKIAYDGYNYILTVVDFFSKKGYALALKNKEGRTVRDAMKKILDSMPIKPASVRSDNGSEFKSNLFKKLLESFAIKHVFSSPHTPQSNGLVERFNGVLKNVIIQYIHVTKTNNWPPILKMLVDNYNDTFHSTIKNTPNTIHEQDAESHPQTTELIKSKAKQNINTHVLYSPGDHVRVVVNKIDTITNTGLPFIKWSKKIYTIDKIFRPKQKFTAPYYTIKGFTTHFYNNDLQKITNVQNVIDKDTRYRISKILSPKVTNGIIGYLVKWVGYKDPTFEPRKNLDEDVPKMLKQYENKTGIKWYENGNIKYYYYVDKDGNRI